MGTIMILFLLICALFPFLRFVEQKKKPLFLHYSYNYINLLSTVIASLAQVNKVLNGPDLSMFCHDTGTIRGRSIFLPVRSSTS